ncbi:hypothetical protein SUS17_634 [Sphingomonas sp. S17]|uniref:FUSC family protein n=2 Tax=Sphingomonas paucimobilis TaxID=13689 RepID=A0A411LJL0_SPHPI|nr:MULTISPECIES: FUSC family protein [Sphingomonas]EGI56557.1 hypothetical protein SUS17_634 [Sphingomonas sp. S17]MBQ1479107.1 FUSC family protein [Sphingomonas sp.]MCM3678600.1 FUSC family protein [Sphingomonas paucimobilis]MDG5969627.1 FUSC family protein [Sphingomonas paucimobilis]NNG59540.1 FUSC family protein [Sphingomonas paucimobilis]
MRPPPALRSWVTAHLSWAEAIRAAAFVIRCTGAAVLALVVADALHLDHPIWASVSALVVSQEKLGDTNRTLAWRVVATLIGVAVATAVALVMPGAGPVTMLAVAVGLTAAIARLRVDLRAGMWTSVIVLLTVPPGGTVPASAMARAQEVLLGVAIGAALHWIADRMLFRRTG